MIAIIFLSVFIFKEVESNKITRLFLLSYWVFTFHCIEPKLTQYDMT